MEAYTSAAGASPGLTPPAVIVREGKRVRFSRTLGAGTLAAALTLLVLALFAAWELHNALGVTYTHWGVLGRQAGDEYDEGAYVISAQLLLRGYALFHTVFSAQPALFLPSLAVVVGLVPNPTAAGHVYELLCGLIVLAGVAWMAWTAYRALAAPFAVGLLAVSPGFLLYAHAVESEMPMLALCTLAVAAAQSYYQTPRRSVAALAGFLLMAGTEMKLLSVVMVLPLALLLLGGAWRGHRAGRTRPALAADALAFIVLLVVPAMLALALLAPSDQLRQVILFHLAAGRTLQLRSESNIQSLGIFFSYDPGLLLAAGGAIVSLWRGRDRGEWGEWGDLYLPLVYALWFLSALLFLWRYHPLLQHQFIPLLPPLALLGAALMAPRAAAAQRIAPSSRAWRRMPAVSTATILAALVGVAYLVVLGLHTITLDGRLLAHNATPNRDRLAQVIDRATRPGDFVVVDDPMVALDAHRLLPPGMEDPSMVRMSAGYLTSAQAEQSTSRYHVPIVVSSRPKYVHGVLVGSVFGFYLPEYLSWIGRHYHTIPNPISGAQVHIYIR